MINDILSWKNILNVSKINFYLTLFSRNFMKLYLGTESFSGGGGVRPLSHVKTASKFHSK